MKRSEFQGPLPSGFTSLCLHTSVIPCPGFSWDRVNSVWMFGCCWVMGVYLGPGWATQWGRAAAFMRRQQRAERSQGSWPEFGTGGLWSYRELSEGRPLLRGCWVLVGRWWDIALLCVGQRLTSDCTADVYVGCSISMLLFTWKQQQYKECDNTIW